MWVLFIVSALAQDPSAAPAAPTAQQIAPEVYDELKKRFVSTAAETRIDSQMMQIPEIRRCVEQNKIEDTDFTNNSVSTSTKTKREKAQKCMADILAQKDEEDIKTLADQLQLQQFNLVAGTNRQNVVKFFTDRIQRAIYGQGAEGENRALRDKTLVGQEVFATMHRSQISRDILLHLSNYCLNQLMPKGGAQNFESLTSIISGADCRDVSSAAGPGLKLKSKKDLLLTCFPDALEDTGSTSPTPGSQTPYEVIQGQFGTNGTTPAMDANQIQAGFGLCIQLIPVACEVRSYCDAKAKAAAAVPPIPFDSTPYKDFPQNFSCSSTTIGAASCVMQTRLKAYRSTMTVINNNDRDFYSKVEDGTAIPEKETKFRLYRENDAGSSIADITNLTSKDMEDINKLNKPDQTRLQDCSEHPEVADCEEFFYTDQERLRFEQEGSAYAIATTVESARINALKKDKSALKTYLTERGYLDLVQQLDGGATEESVVALARQRFEAERNAAYSAMEAKFVQNQQHVGVAGVTTTLEERFKAEQNNLTQLMVFNNIVTSFLAVGTEGATNELARRKEFEALQDGNAQAYQFFSGITGAQTSSGGDQNATVMVDMNLLDDLTKGEIRAPETNGTR
jgi:hypothetical protein